MQSELLDTIIGVVFVWFLLSMVLAAIAEGIALVLRARANHLWWGIAQLLRPAVQAAGTNVQFQPVVRVPKVRPVVGKAGVSGDNAQQQVNERIYAQLAPTVIEIAAPGNKSKITHVARDAFANAVIAVAGEPRTPELIAQAQSEGWSADKVTALATALAGLGAGSLDRSQVEGVATTEITADELTDLYDAASTSATVADITEFVKENAQLRRAINQAIATVEASEQVVAAKKVIENWFEAKMDQLTALYRRQRRKLLALLALPLVLVTHANAIALFQDLRRDSALRAAVVARAVDEAAYENFAAAMKGACAPRADGDDVSKAVDNYKCAAKVLDRASEFRVGLAWEDMKSASGVKGEKATLELADMQPYLGHALRDDWGFLGRTLTWLALLFGAQFWFDVLRRLTGLRTVLRGPTAPSG